MKAPPGKFLQGLRALVAGTENVPSPLMILLFTVASLIMIGYKFAVWDQLLYLTCVDRLFQPIIDNPNDLYIRDFLVRSYTTFWVLFYPLKQTFGWEWPLFVIHFVVKFFMLWSFWALTLALTKDRLAAWICLALMLVNRAIVGWGINMYMADTITRYVVFPFMIFAIKRLWERKYTSSALLFGIGFQLHAVTTIYWILAIVIAIGTHWIIDREHLLPSDPAARRAELKKIGWGIVFFLILALPMLIWSGLTPVKNPGDFRTKEFMEFVQAKQSYIFFSSYTPDAWKTLLLTILLICLTVRRLPVNPISRWYVPWTFGILGVLLIHFIATDVLMYQPIYKLQMIRTIDLLGLLSMIGAAYLLAQHARGTCRQRWLAAFVGALFLSGVVAPGWSGEFFGIGVLFLFLLELEPAPGRFSIPAILILLAFVGLQSLHPPEYYRNNLRTLAWPAERNWVVVIAFLLMLIGFGAWFWQRRLLRNITLTTCLSLMMALICFERIIITEQRGWRGPGPDPDAGKTHWQLIVGRTKPKITWPGEGMKDDWIQFQLWIRDNTPPGTIFFVPPTQNGFRVFSQRNSFFEIYDSEPGIFLPAYTHEVIERMKLFEYWPPSERTAERGEQTYHSMNAGDWQELSGYWDVPYLITSRPVRLPFPKLYQRGNFTLWQIEPAIVD